MGGLRGTARMFGENFPETLEQEFRDYANLERREAIECIAKAIRKGDVRAAVWFLTATARLLTPNEAAACGVIPQERTQPVMLPRRFETIEGGVGANE